MTKKQKATPTKIDQYKYKISGTLHDTHGSVPISSGRHPMLQGAAEDWLFKFMIADDLISVTFTVVRV